MASHMGMSNNDDDEGPSSCIFNECFISHCVCMWESERMHDITLSMGEREAAVRDKKEEKRFMFECVAHLEKEMR